MPDQLQLRGGTTVQHSTFTGASKEVTVDTTKKTVVVHDGATAGGVPMMREDASNAALALGSAATPSLKFSGDTNTGIYSPGSDQVAISTAGSGRLFVDASGNVGIAATSPSVALDVAPTTSSAIIRIHARTNTLPVPAIELVRGTNPTFGADAYGDYRIKNDSGSLAVEYGDSGATTERLRITSAGLVGIGTASPTGTLQIQPANSNIPASALVVRQNNGADTSQNTFSIEIDPVNNVSRLISTGTTSPQMSFYTGASERARLDASGRLLVGTSTSLGTSAFDPYSFQLAGTNDPTSSAGFFRFQANAAASILSFTKSRGASVGTNTIVADGDNLGILIFRGADGTGYIQAASVSCQVDGTPSSNDMPGRIVLSTTLDGASSPTERFRITSDGVIAHDQPAPATYAAAATLTVADLKTGIITYTGTAATLTLPTGTLTEGGFSGIYTNMAFEWSVINTGAGICTIGAGTAHTIVGSATVAIGASARFTSRRTTANTFVTYRLS
jgi:hypothetical protein